MVTEFISSPFGQSILVFLLVFVLVFAILQKAKILGDGKKQIDALVALSIGLLVLSAGYALDIIINLVPFLAVSLVVILVFLVMWGAFFQAGKFEINKYVQWAAGAMVFIALVVAVLVITGAWDFILNRFTNPDSPVLANTIFIVIVVVAILAMSFGGGKGDK